MFCNQVEVFSLWQFVTIGNGIRTQKQVEEEMKSRNERINSQLLGDGRRLAQSDNAKNVLSRLKVPFRVNPVSIRLAKVSLGQLGLKKTSRERIYETALSRGLFLAPQETGFQHRLKYLNQPTTERLIVASEPIKGDASSCDLLVVDCDQKRLMLRAFSGNRGAYWGEEFQWLFALDNWEC